MAGTSTSLLGDSQVSTGLLLQVGNNSSPETMQTICNAFGLTLPIMTDVQDVTNFGDQWHRRRPTLNDMGKIQFKIYWIMEEPTHRNSLGGGAIPAGLRYLMINRLLRDFQIVYPDGNNSTDAFPAYVTSFQITGQIGKVFEANIELSNSGPPSLV